MLPTTLARGNLREVTRAMRTTRRLNGNLHGARRTIFRFWFFFGWMSELIDCSNQKKNCACNNEKVDQQRNEVAVIPSDRSGFRGVCWSIECRRPVFRRSQNHKFVGEIESASEEADRRHDHVFYQ